MTKKKILRSKRFNLISVLTIAVLLSTMVLVRFYRGKRKAEKEFVRQYRGSYSGLPGKTLL